jgi:hypothetical protein
MAFQSYWYKTYLPQEIIDIIIKDLEKNTPEESFKESELINGEVNHKKRKSKNTWIETTNWLGGLLWYYIDKMNEENFRYDLKGIENDSIQYTKYEEGEYYGWHTDSAISELYVASSTKRSIKTESQQQNELVELMKINTECIRKLSFTVQLSDPDSYEGGDVQMIDESGSMYTVPREKGTIVVFDSRTRHRVCKVTKGTRRSLVGWCVGPRWR